MSVDAFGLAVKTMTTAAIAKLPTAARICAYTELDRNLWVAPTNRHADCAADLPLRMNRSIRRLYLICLAQPVDPTVAIAWICRLCQ